MSLPAGLPISALSQDLRPTGAWATALLLALARDESAGRRPARLTEPQLATWTRFRGRLTSTDLLALLFEDAAVLHPIPFNPAALGAPDDLRLPRLPAEVADAWLEALPQLDLGRPGADHIAAQARLLGLPTRLGRSDLHALKPHHKVLELPGTGGQLAHHLVSTQPGLSLQDNFAIACATWQELTLAGLVALDLGAPHCSFIHPLPPAQLRDDAHPLRKRVFDYVVGLHPDKGGLFQFDEQLAMWFSSAKILLV